MTDKLTPWDENINGEKTEPSNKEKTSVSTVSDPTMPPNYINPFDSDNLAPDSYPYFFADIDFELKQKPRMFSGFDKMKVDINSESKSENARIWQYNRWRTWKFHYSQPFKTVVMTREDNEPADSRGTVSVNGVVYYILKGVEVEVPEDIKDMILTSQSQTSIAGRQSLVSSLSKKLDPVTGLPKDSTRLER